MPTAEKQQQIQEFKELYDATQLLVVVENRGLDAEQTVALRRKVFETGGKLRVFKNTLAIKALLDITDTASVLTLGTGSPVILQSMYAIPSIK